ncbi:hypothetical protein QUA82_12525 [Microcoleus sp. F8-D3]
MRGIFYLGTERTNLSFGRSKLNEQAFNIFHNTVNIPFRCLWAQHLQQKLPRSLNFEMCDRSEGATNTIICAEKYEEKLT